MKSLLKVLPLLSFASGEYTWPSWTDHLEDIVYLQQGYIRFGFIDDVNPCGFNTHVEGRQNSAEWIRTAFHDMATHNISAGTGGLDASILFEGDRMENQGDAFNNTFGFFFSHYSKKSSASDLLALGVVVSASMCGGHRIPYRVGRIDAVEAGPSGVPEPHQDLDTHLSMYENMGFTREEMIKSVACGHSLGGIHGVNFPDITGNDTEGNVERFDTTHAALDPAVVTEYLDGTTQNLLVVGANDTLNSDKRVFGADGNVTVKALADPENFQNECAAIFEKMINTVPSGVNLTEPLAPVDIKPYITKLGLNGDGSLGFEGRIRVRTTEETGRQHDDLAVQLQLKDREGNDAGALAAPRATYKLGQSIGLWRESFTWFEYSGSIPSDVGISGFDVVMWTISTNASETFNNAGTPFPVTDAILYLKDFSCLDTTIVDGYMDLTVAAAVRSDKANRGVRVDLELKTPRQGVILPGISTESHAMESTGFQYAGYELFKVQMPLLSDSWSTRFNIVLGEGEAEEVVDFLDTSSLAGITCQPMPQ